MTGIAVTKMMDEAKAADKLQSGAGRQLSQRGHSLDLGGDAQDLDENVDLEARDDGEDVADEGKDRGDEAAEEATDERQDSGEEGANNLAVINWSVIACDGDR